MSVHLTEQQHAAVSARGHVIVSASAGSGKTFVMIERLVSLILGGEDVRNILAVTFTNKAAAQMRERLRSALLAGIAARSGAERERLKAQLAALPLAEISTIHAFCGRLVRTYFYAAGVDPAFRIAGGEDADGKELSARAMDAAFEQAYREDSKDLALLLGVYFRRRRDDNLKRLVASVHAYARGMADYRTLLADMGASDRFEEACEDIRADVAARADMVLSSLAGYGHVYAALGEKAAALADEVTEGWRRLQVCGDLFAMREEALLAPPTGRMVVRRNASAEERAALACLSGAKKLLGAVREELSAFAERETERARCADAARLAGALGRMALAYDACYAQEKADAGVLDYNDLEHLALRLLENEEVRRDLQGRFRAVFVDEYQDVNPVQEQLISRLAGEDVFLVGDSKQAIYGFRGSRSRYFTEKARTFPVSLDLSVNFRSAPAVLDAVNRVFAPLDRDYVPMQGGERYAGHAGEVRLHLLPKEKAERTPPQDVYSVAEHAGEETADPLGEKVARLVEEELHKTWFDADEGREKQVTFGDIAVLTRRRGGEAQLVARALLSRGIPVTTAAEVNICDFFEARLLIDWLSYLDNAAQDIPLAAALLSAVGGLTEEELARVRLSPEGGTGAFTAACEAFAAAHPADPVARKLTAFYARAAALRVHARVRTAAEVMNELLAAGLEAQIAAKPGGESRLARVARLVAEGEGLSVNAFLSRLRASDFTLGFSESGGEDSVRIVTMHASKGLEYPVVILAGTDVRFRGAGEQEEVIRTERFLAAPKAYDRENRIAYTTVVRRAAALSSLAEEREQERNLLYVGMTRAKYRLHIVFRDREGGVLSPRLAMRGAEFFDFAALGDLFVSEADAEGAAPARRALAYRPDEGMTQDVLRVYCRPYPFAESTCLRVKSSATELLRTRTGKFLPAADTAYLDADEPFTGKTSKEAGIAYHAFLQHVRFGADAAAELARMVREGALTAQQAALLEVEHLRAVLELPALRELPAKRVLREQTFLMRLPASEMTAGAPEDEIVFQGAIDLLTEQDGTYEVIDYKYSVLSDAALAEKYAVQIALYKKAAACVTGTAEKDVRARIVNIARCREIVM